VPVGKVKQKFDAIIKEQGGRTKVCGEDVRKYEEDVRVGLWAGP